jgi:hypothetical protein
MSGWRARLDGLHLPDDPITAGEVLAGEGLGDGLAVRAPTPERVGALLDSAGPAPGGVRFPLSPEDTTAADIAVVSAMAGCEPGWFPIVLAALRAATAPEFNLLGVITTTSAVVPLVLVVGPVVARVGLGATENALVNPAPANRAIGRSVGLALRIFGNALPGVPNPSTLGHPAKPGWCVAERTDDNPWTVVDADRVSVAGASGSIELVLDGDTVDDVVTLLASACEAVAHAGLRPGRGRRPVIVVLPPETARRLAAAGYDRPTLSAALQWDPDGDEGDVVVVVTGGVGIKGAVIPTWGAGRIVTVQPQFV